MEERYLFNNGSNWVLGPTKECTIPSGHYRKTHFLRDGVDWVGFVNVHDSGDVFQPLPVTSYLKNADGDPYASLVEINAAISGFFFSVGSFYSGFKTVQITGDGVNTDYAMPVDCNIAAPFIINSDIYSAELVLVSGVKKIRFSEVLTDEQFPVVAYTPTVATDPTTRKKQYTAYWTQTGTNAPVAVEQEDDIEPVLARSSAGVYTATKAGAFVEGKTVPISESYVDAETGNKMKMVRTSADVMTITTYLAADLETPADGVLTNQYIHFEIFN